MKSLYTSLLFIGQTHSLKDFFSIHRYKILLAFFLTIYILYFTFISFLRYDNFYTGRFDLGNMDQAVWNTLHGRIFQTTDPNGTSVISRLAFHADFILILLAPFYLLWEDPRMLLLIQTIVISTGAIFIFLLSKRLLKNEPFSFVLSLAYLLNPSVQYANLYDFHAVSLATTFLLASFYFFLCEKYYWSIGFAVLAGLTKEHVWFILFLISLYLAGSKAVSQSKNENTKFSRRLDIIGILLAGIVALLLFYYLIWHAIPTASGNKHFAISYYSEFGDSPGKVIKNISLSPIKSLGVALQNDRLVYLYQLFLPLGFLPVIFPFPLLFAAPDLAINLLSNNNNLHQIYYQYTSTITPFIFLSTIYAVKQLRKRFTKIPFNFFLYYLILTTLYSAYVFGPLPASKEPNINMITKPQPFKETISSVLSTIPKNASVAATNNLGSHLSHRTNIYTIPNGVNDAQFLVFLTGAQFNSPIPKEENDLIQKLLHNDNYQLIFSKENFTVFQNKK